LTWFVLISKIYNSTNCNNSNISQKQNENEKLLRKDNIMKERSKIRLFILLIISLKTKTENKKGDINDKYHLFPYI
jgi:hypothetical protein